MSAKKSQRFTISGRNFQFLKTIAQQMDEDNLTAALSYLLTDIRCLGYVIGDKQAPKPQSQQPLAPIGYAFDPSTFEKITPIPEVDRNYSEDPIITRMRSLIEDF